MSPSRLSFAVLVVLFVLSGSTSFANDAVQKRNLPKSKGKYVLILPEGYSKDKTYDLVVALHGMGDTAENFAAFWVSSLKGRDSILAVPQGGRAVRFGGCRVSGRAARTGYSWSTGDLARIAETVQDATKNFSIDPSRVLLTGFSAGCAMGFHVIAKKPGLFSCFGAVGMSIQRGMASDEELKRAAQSTSVYYAVGKRDPNHRVFKQTVARLKKVGFKVKAEDPNIGHTMTPAICKSMLAFFDASAGASSSKCLAEGKKLLEAKSFGDAEKALSKAASGTGEAATEARQLLAAIRKKFQEKSEKAKALPGPDAVAELRKIAEKYAGLSCAAEARKLADTIAASPETQKLAAERKQRALETEAQTALEKASALEKKGALPKALAAFLEVGKRFGNTAAGAKAREGAARVEKAPKYIAFKRKREAEKLMRQAENFLRNRMEAEAKAILDQVVEKYPETDAGERAKAKVKGM